MSILNIAGYSEFPEIEITHQTKHEETDAIFFRWFAIFLDDDAGGASSRTEKRANHPICAHTMLHVNL